MSGVTARPSGSGPPRLFLFDGSAMAYRSHFAFLKNPLVNSAGRNTSAIYGFVRDLLRVLDDERPERVAVVFDAGKKNFRHERFAEYKATRREMPSDLVSALPTIDQLVNALAIPRLAVEGVEADDVLATLSVQAVARGWQVFLVSTDKDLCQLVNEQVRLYNPWRNSRAGVRMAEGATVMGPAEVEERFGVAPPRIRDWLALVGDSSDNVPGVPGVGPKRAAELIARWGSLEEVLRRASEEPRPALREALLQHADQARLSLELVTLRQDVPLELELEQLVAGQPDLLELQRLFAELEFREYLRRYSTAVDSDPHVHEKVTLAGLPALIDRLRAAAAAGGELVFDLETTSLDPLQAEIVGMAFSIEPGQAFYVGAEERPKKGGAFALFSMELDFSAHLELIKPLLEDPAVKKGGQNVKYDLLVLGQHGVEVRGISFDTLLESYLLDPSSRTHNLDDLALRYLGYRKIATSELIGKGKKQRSMADTPDHEIFPYASEDADITARLHRLFGPQIERQEGLPELYREVELPLLSVLAGMERTGVKVDLEVLGRIRGDFQARLAARQEEVFSAAGKVFNLSSPRQVAELLFEELRLHEAAGIKPKKTMTGLVSTDAEVLEELAAHHPLPALILEHRGLEKLMGTYVEALPGLVNPRTGRVHTSFNQAVTATGRLSSSDPNLQNIPVRTAEGRQIRSAFVAGEPGWQLLSADYSQVELRILAHISGDETLVEAFRNDLDVHRATAARIFDLPLEEVTPELRSRAKAINFGIIYGMGAPRLARSTGLPLLEARKFIEGYFAKYPRIQAYLAGEVERARKQGWVETLLRRRRPLPDIRATHRGARANAERMAVNTPIQGSAADIIKVAMIRIDRRLRAEGLRARMLLQVHDELLFELPAEEAEATERLVREEMQGAFPLAVPLKVDVGRGHSWLEAH